MISRDRIVTLLLALVAVYSLLATTLEAQSPITMQNRLAEEGRHLKGEGAIAGIIYHLDEDGLLTIRGFHNSTRRIIVIGKINGVKLKDGKFRLASKKPFTISDTSPGLLTARFVRPIHGTTQDTKNDPRKDIGGGECLPKTLYIGGAISHSITRTGERDVCTTKVLEVGMAPGIYNWEFAITDFVQFEAVGQCGNDHNRGTPAFRECLDVAGIKGYPPDA